MGKIDVYRTDGCAANGGSGSHGVGFRRAWQRVDLDLNTGFAVAAGKSAREHDVVDSGLGLQASDQLGPETCVACLELILQLLGGPARGPFAVEVESPYHVLLRCEPRSGHPVADPRIHSGDSQRQDRDGDGDLRNDQHRPGLPESHPGASRSLSLEAGMQLVSRRPEGRNDTDDHGSESRETRDVQDHRGRDAEVHPERELLGS